MGGDTWYLGNSSSTCSTSMSTPTWGDSYATSMTACVTDYIKSQSKAIYYKNKHQYQLSDDDLRPRGIPNKLGPGKRSIELPDGAKLEIDENGNYYIEDKDAQVTYKANRNREFSPYLNASDMLAKFVAYVGSVGVKRDEVMGLPIHLFISWLIIEAAEKDGDNVPSDVIPVHRDPMLVSVLKPKCATCGRFVKRADFQQRFPFCSPDHGVVYAERKKLITPADGRALRQLALSP